MRNYLSKPWEIACAKNQVFFELYAPDIHVAQGEFAQFLQRGETDMNEMTLGRLNLLNVPEHEIQALRAGGPVKRRTSVLSPVKGVVLALNVGEGMFVKPDVTTIIVADLSSVWVLADVFEDQASWIEPGLPRHFESGLPTGRRPAQV